jgi:hypothetical protein
VRDAISRFDEYVRALGDPAPPSPPITLRAACVYLLRRATPALVPVAAAVAAQFVLGSGVAGVLLVAGSGAATAGGVAGAALALGRRVTALAAAAASIALLVGPPYVVVESIADLFAVQTGLFGVVSLFVAAVCYAETAGVPRAAVGAESGDDAE